MSNQPENRSPGQTKPRLLEVVRATNITPHMRRITLGGAEIAGFPRGKQGSHLKLFIPRPGQERPVMPKLTETGPVWPPAEERPFARTYTIRAFNAATGELEIDFVLHGDHGPAAAWAANAKPGDVVGIAGPGAKGPIPQEAGWYLFVGDETALPAISAHLETLSSTARGLALIEVADAQEIQQLLHPEHCEVRWLLRNGVPAGQSQLLVEAVMQITPPADPIFAWVAAENSITVTIRNHWRSAWGLARRQIEAIPFWKAGASEERYHEERHRVMDEVA